MRLLDRYLLRELLVPLGYSLCGFLILFVFGNLFNGLGEFQRKKLRAGDIVEYYCYLIATPDFLGIVVPIALLLALLYCLTNLARHQELTAMRAAGVSLWRLCLPYLGVGILASLFLSALNELWLPDSAEEAEQVLNRRLPLSGGLRRNQVRNFGFTNARDHRTWQIGLYDIDTGEMIHPQVHWTLPDGSRRWLDAERAVPVNGVWTFYNVRENKEGPGADSLLVPSAPTNMLAFPEFSETPEQIKSEINITKGLSLLAKNNTDVPVAQILNYLRWHPQPADPARLYTQLHGRLAAPWTCLVVVLIAIPFGAAFGRRNVFVGVASSLVICAVYYVLRLVGLTVFSGAHVAPWLAVLAAWFPNLSIGMVGLLMTSRVR